MRLILVCVIEVIKKKNNLLWNKWLNDSLGLENHCSGPRYDFKNGLPLSMPEIKKHLAL